ncbi:MAG: terpene cyclase/mutase family protein [Pirellulaceae bacterium]|nr:terpene cyclase/mutase family protein [Pirellulaceae bacterium]
MKAPRSSGLMVLCLGLVLASGARLRAQGEWELTLESEQALERGLRWLDQNQGPEGNWSSNDLGLVSLGALAFMAAGHAPGRGEYGGTIQRALDYVMDNAKPSGLLNIADGQRDLYNHGLATFVLGQAHGMTTSRDPRLNKVLDRALRLIASTQCEDGGWDYRARRQARGHDLSLAVMQAKALRSAMDSGLNVPPEVVDLAIRSVREHYTPAVGRREAPESEQRKVPGQFTYTKGGGQASPAMAAAGVVCLQEFGQYDDWRIEKNVDILLERIRRLPSSRRRDGTMPFDAYSLYYIGQALYQVGGPSWREAYPALRDHLVETQVHDPSKPASDGLWRDRGEGGGGRVSGKPGDLFGTSVACFILAIPNRYLPILQEGKIESLRQRFGGGQ